MTNLFVATGDAVARLTQNGDEWTVAHLLTDGMQCLALDLRHPGTLYAGSYGRGIWKSDDSGAHWRDLALAQPDVFSVAVSPVDGTVYAGCEPSMLFRFEPLGDNRTRVSIQLSYNPPAGAIGHAVATLFGADPKSQMDADLMRLKSLFEHGKASVESETVSREEIAQGERLQEREVGAAEAERQQRRESGQPGGGAGRVDRVGRTGIYPASGPLPEGDAEIRTPASWGRASAARRATRRVAAPRRQACRQPIGRGANGSGREVWPGYPLGVPSRSPG